MLLPGLGAPIGLIGGGVPDVNTLLLLHCNGADTSTTFIDSSRSHKTVTPNGNSQIDTAQSKFGGASSLFDGTGDYLSVPDSEDWNFGTGSFTFDFWVRFNAAPTAEAHLCIQGDPAGLGVPFNFYCSPTTISFYASSNGFAWDIALAKSIGAISVGNWKHIAVVRSGNDFATYYDGTQVTTWTNSGTLNNNASTLNIGGWSGGAEMFNGWIDEFRISNVARWTSGFTPPTNPY